MANKHMKRSLTSLDIWEMKINTTIGYDCTPMRMAKIKKKKSTTTKWWQRFRVSIADGNAKL